MTRKFYRKARLKFMVRLGKYPVPVGFRCARPNLRPIAFILQIHPVKFENQDGTMQGDPNAVTLQSD
jgi:hypothetical protein